MIFHIGSVILYLTASILYFYNSKPIIGTIWLIGVLLWTIATFIRVKLYKKERADYGC
jgi:hypothetical protein